MVGIDISSSVNWSAEQWEVYEKTNVVLELNDYDTLINAVNLLVKGSRLSPAERRNWAHRIEAIHKALLLQLPEFAR